MSRRTEILAAVLGISQMGKKKYFTFQLISCLIWSIICTSGGYFFGAALKTLLGNVKRYEPYIAVGVLIIGFITWFLRDVRKRSHDNGGI
jgi:membrane protein DedA with SNARE-associated domain